MKWSRLRKQIVLELINFSFEGILVLGYFMYTSLDFIKIVLVGDFISNIVLTLGWLIFMRDTSKEID